MKLQKMIATVGAVAVMAGSFGTMGVMANNYKDSDYTFSYATGGNVYATTEGRRKEDSTSSYMKCNSYVHTASNGSGTTTNYTSFSGVWSPDSI